MRSNGVLQRGYTGDSQLYDDMEIGLGNMRRLGWSRVDVALTNPNQVEYPVGQSVQMNVLMWNCRGALNPDFKRRIF